MADMFRAGKFNNLVHYALLFAFGYILMMITAANNSQGKTLIT